MIKSQNASGFGNGWMGIVGQTGMLREEIRKKKKRKAINYYN